MSFKKALIFVSIVLWLNLWSGTVATGLAQESSPDTGEFVPGEILVKFQPYVSVGGAQASLRASDFRPVEVSRRNEVLRVRVTPGQEAEAIAELQARGDIEYVTYNYLVQATDSPNDPDFPLQWGLHQESGYDMNAPEGWDFFTGGDDIIIAVIDTGVDLDHPDLQDKIVPGYDFVNLDSNPQDDNGHGTHVAGIAAASTNNGIGVAGVSWGSKIMPLKALNSAGGGTIFDVTDALYYAADHGANIINMSLGATRSQWPCEWEDMEAAFDYALSKGILIIVSAGNDGQEGVNCPGAYDQVMAVGSTTSMDTLSHFSNYGTRLDITAPGSNIYSTLIDGYGYKSGTSMATPYVSGLAALIWSYDPSLSYREVRNFIELGADQLSSENGIYAQEGVVWSKYFGYGRINVRRSLDVINLQTSPQKLSVIIYDDSDPLEKDIFINVNNSDVVSWNATISPPVPWLGFETAISPTHTLSSTEVSGKVTLVVTQPPTHGSYSATISFTGTTTSNLIIGPVVVDSEVVYKSESYPVYLPVIQK